MGRRLNYIKLNNAPGDIDIFGQLYSLGCRLNHIEIQYSDDAIFSQLAQSNQSKYVKFASVEQTTVVSPSLLQNMTSLSSLTLEDELSINLAEYMYAFPPSFTTFDLNCNEIELSNVPTCPNNIRALSISCTNLPKPIDSVILTYCPKLIKLEL